ncbi:MAG: Usg family protein [Alphaproteobacteria bacterium HGW-Alphaproteobacteria-12]|nr:MAG: Usg family protein [Alphaproteobacteria bacterium HGW-Alphaproteobacteria-12]
MRQVSELQRLIDGYRLVTAEILYRMPDHPKLLQSYIWQDYDLEPKYPALSKFLDFWGRELDGPIHSVQLATRRVIHPSEFVRADFAATLH